MTSRRRVRYVQRYLSVHLIRFPKQTCAGILNAQPGSKAYVDVQNDIFLDRDRRTKIYLKLPYHSRRKEISGQE